MARILLADDNQEVLVMLSSWLKLKDRHTVDTAEDGRSALEFLSTYSYDAVVLDWEMPGIEGVEVCRQFRRRNNLTPVIMLTGRDATEDKIVGLDAGSDDYLTKPFSAEELSARIRALLRRSATPPCSTVKLQSAGIVVEPDSRKVTAQEKELSLSPTEYNLLVFFITHSGQGFSAEQVVARVWGDPDEANPATLRTAIKRLRRKIEAAMGSCPLVNERTLGYYWQAKPE